MRWALASALRRLVLSACFFRSLFQAAMVFSSSMSWRRFLSFSPAGPGGTVRSFAVSRSFAGRRGPSAGRGARAEGLGEGDAEGAGVLGVLAVDAAEPEGESARLHGDGVVAGFGRWSAARPVDLDGDGGLGRKRVRRFQLFKARISVVFHSIWLIFGRAIIHRGELKAWMLFSLELPSRTPTLKRR